MVTRMWVYQEQVLLSKTRRYFCCKVVVIVNFEIPFDIFHTNGNISLNLIFIYNPLINNFTCLTLTHRFWCISTIYLTLIHSAFHDNTTLEGRLIERGSERQKSEHGRDRTSKVFLGWSECWKIRTSKIRTSKRTSKVYKWFSKRSTTYGVLPIWTKACGGLW
jgi:hypothetical protein